MTGVNGEPVRQAEDLISTIEEKNEGDKVYLNVLKKCDPMMPETIEVTLTTRDKLRTKPTQLSPAGAKGSVSIPWQ